MLSCYDVETVCCSLHVVLKVLTLLVFMNFLYSPVSLSCRVLSSFIDLQQSHVRVHTALGGSAQLFGAHENTAKVYNNGH